MVRFANMLARSCTFLVQAFSKTAVDFGPHFAPSELDNMNGEYSFSTTPGGKPNMFPKQFKDYPGGVESFEVYMPPITTLYSQVWWHGLAPVDFPPEIVKKYNGTGMAIVGWEIDQVRRTSEGDVSVPINALYNHHFNGVIIGKEASFRKVTLTGPDDPLAGKVAKQPNQNNAEEPSELGR